MSQTNKYVNFEMDNNILVATYKKASKINLEIAKTIVEARLNFTERKELPVLVYNQGVVSMDKLARDFLSSTEGVKGLKAGAIILDSPFTSLLSNFFIKVSKPKIPAKTFTNKTAALKWLKQYVS
jgi:hypothetical protein